MTQIKNNILQHWEKLDASWRFACAAFVIARIVYLVWTWVILTIQPVAIQNFEHAGEPLISIFKVENSEAHLYSREVNGHVFTFQVYDFEHLIDQQSQSLWDSSSGEAIQGKYIGTVLPTPRTSLAAIFPYHDLQPYPSVWLAVWQRFDANWYVSIAGRGYGGIPGDDHYPPLFPLLIRILEPVVGNAFLAGIIISQAATVLMLKLFHDVIHQWGDKTIGARALLFFVIFPTFFFFFSAYSEPVFLVFSLLALRRMQQQNWAWAGFWVFCAISTRLQGVALLPPMIYLIWNARQLDRPSAWFGSLVAGSSGLFYLFLRSTQVNGSALPLEESIWRARLVPPWETYWYAVRNILAGNAGVIDILNWAVMTLFIILLIWGWKKIPLEYNLYTAFSIFIILIRIVENQPLISMSRYSLTLFPVFHAWALAGEHPILRRVIIYSSVLLHLYLSGQFFLWGWVA